ncbi:hypothetical protein P4O66_022481 [Electrophorus voltai]|uniref:Uncharacterized protein n=1 Tax=Electrophorus voltai TaxID=2609070 RepID=A0AAD9E2D7_9TELE|nr:hypothetical protein P4O66_022481 [Electrophorus voltai]
MTRSTVRVNLGEKVVLKDRHLRPVVMRPVTTDARVCHSPLLPRTEIV